MWFATATESRSSCCTEVQMSDYKGARLILDALLPADTTLIADRGYGFAKRLKPRTSRPAFHQPKAAKPARMRQEPLSPPSQDREPVPQTQGLAAYRRKIRSMRNAFFSAICIAAALAFSLNQ